MSLNDGLADALSKINNAVRALKKEVILKRSKLLIEVLKVLQEHGYVGNFEVMEDGKQGLIKLELTNSINRCGAIKPRFPVKVDEMEKYERRFLPAKDFGIIIVSTTKGLMTQHEVVKENCGGVLIAYCY